MSSTSPSRSFLRLSLALLLGLALTLTGCSDDDGDDAATDDTSAQEGGSGEGGDTEEWCAELRRGINAVPSEQVSHLESQMEAAPDELKADYEQVIDYVVHREENPTDAVGIAERTDAITEPFRRLITAADDECGISINLGG